MKLLHHDALDALDEEARKDEAQPQRRPPDARATVSGLARENLLKRAGRIVLPVESKKLKRFREDTKRLVEAKEGSGRWTGFPKELPPLRRRPGTAGTSLLMCKDSPEDEAQPQRGTLRTDTVGKARSGRRGDRRE